MTTSDRRPAGSPLPGLVTEIPELRVTPSRHQLFMFSAVTWNRHHVHYDKDAALREGFDDVVVHRALIGNFFGQLLTRWAGHHGQVRKLSWKVVRSALPDRELRCVGEVVREREDSDGQHLVCDLVMTDPEGETVARGQGLVSCLPPVERP